ncbi:MAG: OmpH family outer membrane protein [Salibacteraceae bacterium]
MKSPKFIPFFAAVLTLVFSACDNEPTAKNATDNKDESPKEVNSGTLKFGYVNTDSLSTQFELIKDMEDEIVAERTKLEGQYQAMVQNLQRDYEDAQAGASGLSQEALAILQQKLQQKEQEVMRQKNRMENQLMEIEQEKTQLYLDKVQGFISDYAKKEGYDMIYGFNGLNNLLYIDKGYDLTAVIVDSLNTRYSKEKLQAQK